MELDSARKKKKQTEYCVVLTPYLSVSLRKFTACDWPWLTGTIGRSPLYTCPSSPPLISISTVHHQSVVNTKHISTEERHIQTRAPEINSQQPSAISQLVFLTPMFAETVYALCPWLILMWGNYVL